MDIIFLFQQDNIFQLWSNRVSSKATDTISKVGLPGSKATGGQVTSAETGKEGTQLLRKKSVIIGAVSSISVPPPDRGGWVEFSSAWVPVLLGRAWPVGSPAD